MIIRLWETTPELKILCELVRNNPVEFGNRLDIELFHAKIFRTMHASNRGEGDADATLKYVAGMGCVSELQKSLRAASRRDEAAFARANEAASKESVAAVQPIATSRPRAQPRNKASRPRGVNFNHILSKIAREMRRMLEEIRAEAQQRKAVMQIRSGKEFYVTGNSTGKITAQQLPGGPDLSKELVDTAVPKLEKKFAKMDPAWLADLQEVKERGFDAAAEIVDGHFWGVLKTGVGFSHVIETGGRVQTAQQRSLVRMFVPSLPDWPAALDKGIQDLSEACIKLLGFYRASLGVPIMDPEEANQHAAEVGGDVFSDDDDDVLIVPSDLEGDEPELVPNPSKSTARADVNLLDLEVHMPGGLIVACRVVSIVHAIMHAFHEFAPCVPWIQITLILRAHCSQYAFDGIFSRQD